MPRVPDEFKLVERKSGPKRSKTQIEEERATIARLDRRGWTQKAIAEHLGLSQPLISYELKKIRQRYIESAREQRDIDVGMQIAQHRDIIAEAWRAWDASWQAEQERKKDVKEVSYSEGESVKTTRKVNSTRGRLPGQQYLDTIQRSLEAIAKLKGLNKEVVGGQGTNNYFFDWRAMATGKLPNAHDKLEELLRNVEALPPAPVIDVSTDVDEQVVDGDTVEDGDTGEGGYSNTKQTVRSDSNIKQTVHTGANIQSTVEDSASSPQSNTKQTVRPGSNDKQTVRSGRNDRSTVDVYDDTAPAILTDEDELEALADAQEERERAELAHPDYGDDDE